VTLAAGHDDQHVVAELADVGGDRVGRGLADASPSAITAATPMTMPSAGQRGAHRVSPQLAQRHEQRRPTIRPPSSQVALTTKPSRKWMVRCGEGRHLVLVRDHDDGDAAIAVEPRRAAA
jgi:hypothetical protein